LQRACYTTTNEELLPFNNCLELKFYFREQILLLCKLIKKSLHINKACEQNISEKDLVL
jgi:hypothetical protein